MRIEWGNFNYICETCNSPTTSNAKWLGQGNNCMRCAMMRVLIEV